MTSSAPARFEVRDDDLPDRLPLATAGDFPTALAQLARLHEEFFASLAANGEGATELSQRLRVDELLTGTPPRARYWSSVGGPPDRPPGRGSGLAPESVLREFTCTQPRQKAGGAPPLPSRQPPRQPGLASQQMPTQIGRLADGE